MSTPFESCCPPGSHGGPPAYFDEDPKGSFVTAGRESVPCYFVESPTASTKAMILFPDIWGFKSRILRIADLLAQQGGCHVLVCDFFRGETKDDHDDMKKWFQSVPYEPNIANDVKACVNYLKTTKEITEFGAMGFCWGNWAIAKTCQGALVDWKLAVCPHPSFKVEPWCFGGDDVALMQSMTCPVLMMPAGNDPPYTHPTSAEFQAMPHPANKGILFRDMAHGWTTRGDMVSDANLKRDVEGALKAALEFVKEQL